MNFNLEEWLFQIEEYINNNFSKNNWSYIILVAWWTASW
jgi:hypothetical protein